MVLRSKPLLNTDTAMDNGIVRRTARYDRALMEDEEGNPWPMN